MLWWMTVVLLCLLGFLPSSLSFISLRLSHISCEFLGMLILDVGLHARDPMSWIVLEINSLPWASAPTTWVTRFCFSWATNPTPQFMCLSHVNIHILSFQSKECPHGWAAMVGCPKQLGCLQCRITNSPSCFRFSCQAFANWPQNIIMRWLALQVDALNWISYSFSTTRLNTRRHGGQQENVWAQTLSSQQKPQPHISKPQQEMHHKTQREGGIFFSGHIWSRFRHYKLQPLRVPHLQPPRSTLKCTLFASTIHQTFLITHNLLYLLSTNAANWFQ